MRNTQLNWSITICENHFRWQHSKNKVMEDSLCVLPWLHLQYDSNRIFPCCRSNKTFNGPKTNPSSWIEAFNSSEFTQLRKDMLAGKKPRSCNECWAFEKSGIKSLRQKSNEYYRDELKAIKEVKKIECSPEDIKYLTTLTSNSCNLACRTCGPEFSTSWNNDAIELGDLKEPYINRAANIDVTTIPNCDRFYFAGGEPLLEDQHFNFIKELINQGRADQILLSYSTNLSIPPLRLEKFISLWKEFKEVKIYASIDHIDEEKFNYIRHLGNWNLIKENIFRLRSELNNMTIGVQLTLSIFNIYNLPEIIDYFLYKLLIKPKNIYLHPIIHPVHYSPSILDNESKEEIKIEVTSYIKKLYLQEKLNTEIMAIGAMMRTHIKMMLSQDNHSHFENFYRLTMKLDKIRNQSLAHTFPWLYERVRHHRKRNEGEVSL
jgi:MoaA/NifB/PqqE/SkfB family radical SAM enzyme